ncbi:hypothetical protein [Janthinobacterium rivuli]|uniref:hypothetical protein n=1 Tax=Janthinobacterium rivuli TaxID=2751478 RepID=UPI00383ACF1D
MTALQAALLLHGLLGGADVILNHELLVRLPSRPGAAAEQRLHSAREAIFGLLFPSLGLFSWHGWLACWPVALLLAEILVSLRDTVVEGDTRRLPVPERILHVLLFINLGVIATLLLQALPGWLALPTAMQVLPPGGPGQWLAAMGAISLAWCVRDGLSARRLRLRAAQHA